MENTSYTNYEKIRASRGLNDTQVSKMSGVPRATFSDWKAGRSKPKTDKLQLIADVLQVSLITLTGAQVDFEVVLSDDERILIEEYRNENANGRLHKYASALADMKREGGL